mgnify:CR=1 FL=1
MQAIQACQPHSCVFSCCDAVLNCELQTLIQDRRAVYKILLDAGIAVPNHIVVNREGLTPDQDPPGFLQEVNIDSFSPPWLHGMHVTLLVLLVQGTCVQMCSVFGATCA